MRKVAAFCLNLQRIPPQEWGLLARVPTWKSRAGCFRQCPQRGPDHRDGACFLVAPSAHSRRNHRKPVLIWVERTCVRVLGATGHPVLARKTWPDTPAGVTLNQLTAFGASLSPVPPQRVYQKGASAPARGIAG